MPLSRRDPVATREKLVTAAVRLIVKNGYHGSGVDAICEEAGVTKGSFFHHFANKDQLGLAVIAWWSAMGTREFSKAWENESMDPLDQLETMLDIMEGFARRPSEPCVCAIGMMAQELAETHPEIRKHCAAELAVWTAHVAALLERAATLHQPTDGFNAERVAWFLNSVWQGSMLLAKTREDKQLIIQNLQQARAYIRTLFPHRTSTRKTS